MITAFAFLPLSEAPSELGCCYLRCSAVRASQGLSHWVWAGDTEMGMLVWDAWGILTCLGNPPPTLPLTSLPGRLRNQKGRSGGLCLTPIRYPKLEPAENNGNGRGRVLSGGASGYPVATPQRPLAASLLLGGHGRHASGPKWPRELLGHYGKIK